MGLLGIVLLFVIFALTMPSIFSTRLALVRGASMGDALPGGSLAFINSVHTSDIDIGDIITFEAPWTSDLTVSHRVIEIGSSGFVTKGDANKEKDPVVIPVENVYGLVSWHIPYLGYAFSGISSTASNIWGFFLMVIVPSGALLGILARDLNFMYNPGKRRARLLKRRRDRIKKRAPHSWMLSRA